MLMLIAVLMLILMLTVLPEGEVELGKKLIRRVIETLLPLQLD